MIRRVSVRYNRREGYFEMRCDGCAASNGPAWWELSTVFWEPRSGLQRCRACQNLAKRLRQRQTVEERRAKQRAYYRDHHDHRLAWKHAYHAAHRDEINRRRREQYAAAKQATSHAETLWELAADG